jgi:hypothetical protein
MALIRFNFPQRTQRFYVGESASLLQSRGEEPHFPPWAVVGSLFADGFAIQYRQSIIDFGLRHGVPVVSGWPSFSRSGALSPIVSTLEASYRRVVHYTDRIPFQGARPPDLLATADELIREVCACCGA